MATKLERLVNVITKWVYMPCSPDPLLYVETAIPALMQFFYGIASPDIREMITMSTGRSSLCHLKHGLNGSGAIEPPNKGRTRRALWRLTEAADLATWYAFIIGLGADALIDWLTPIVKNGGCKMPYQNGNWGYGTSPLGGWPGGGDWAIGPVWRTPNWPDVPQCGPGVFVPAGAWAQWSGTAAYAQLFAGPTPVESRMIIRRTGEVLDQHEGEFNLEEARATNQVTWHNSTGEDQELILQVRFPFVPPAGRIITIGGSGSGYASVSSHPPEEHGGTRS